MTRDTKAAKSLLKLRELYAQISLIKLNKVIWLFKRKT